MFRSQWYSHDRRKVHFATDIIDTAGMDEYSSISDNDPGILGGKLLGLLSKFSTNFSTMIDGRASNTNQHYDGTPLLHSTIGNASGTRPALFVPEISFDILVRRTTKQISNLNALL